MTIEDRAKLLVGKLKVSQIELEMLSGMKYRDTQSFTDFQGSGLHHVQGITLGVGLLGFGFLRRSTSSIHAVVFVSS